MPLGLKFLHSHKKSSKSTKDKFENSTTSSCDDVSVVENIKSGNAENSEELKSFSEPALNISSPGSSNVFEEISSCENLEESTDKVLENLELLEVEEENEKKSSESDLPQDDQEKIPAEMVSSFFDDNGNPVDDDDEEVGNPKPQDSDLVLKDLEVDEDMTNCVNNEDEPTYFINAATLSDDEFTPGSPSASYEKQPKAKPVQDQPEIQATTSIRRVPISRSYPDIVQTTMTMNNQQYNEPVLKCNRKHSEEDSAIRNALQNSIIQADSLEEITDSKPMKAFERIDCESGMSESVLGISNEKPPESWAVDFNSFSLEAELIEQQKASRERKASTSSNSNSLAYFISIDEIESETETSSAALESGVEQKKIFSMFVDIGNTKESPAVESHVPAVMTNSKIAQLRGRTSSPGPGGGSINKYGCKNRFASPGSRSSSRGENKTSTSGSGIPKKVDKSRYSIMTASSSSEQDRNNISNRSSLHVAQYHDGSFTSSLLSSMENSAPEEPEVCQGGPCFKLGMDLLRMFQEGINTDVNISVRGRYVKAHKCILASRSQYFAALLSGNWIQKAGNTIYLDEFTYNVVQFTMYHIYSGTNEIPDSIDLVELATLADLLGLEGLREVISQTIRAKFCHNFHRPCTTCISGSLEFFPLTLSYGMDELHRKMIKWICKHFVRIWPTKAFASLGNDLTDKCLRYSVNHLSAENLLDITLGCDQLLSTMPSVRWTELIFSLVNQLSEACVQFVGENLSQVLQSQRFLVFGKGQTWNISRIDNTFLGGIALLNPDEACLSHVALCRLIELGTETIDEVEWSPIFVDFLKSLRTEVEKLLLANASRAVLSKNWELLSTNTRKMICSTSFMGSDKSGHNKIQIKKSSAAIQAKGERPNSSSTQGASGRKQTINTATITRGTTRTPKEGVAAAVVSPTVSCTSNEQKSLVTTPTLLSSESSSKSMKVASVRPMPKSEKSPARVPTKRSGITSNASNTKPGRPGPQKEKSFEASSSANPSRVNSASSNTTVSRRGSSNRTTPMNPLTPMTPSAKVLPSFPRSSVNRRPPSPPKEQPKKPVFLTNSEKAKAVSKPKLITRTNRSNSITTETSPNPITTHSRQSSLGSNQSTPRTPNMSQTSRFVSTPTASSAAPTTPQVKPKTNSEKTIKPPNSPLPKTRYLTTVSSRLKSTAIANNIPPEPTRKRSNKSNTIMTKSSTETNKQEEPKTRTLAEIGRSNTFSKDEPTILGKLETSHDFDLDYEYDPL